MVGVNMHDDVRDVLKKQENMLNYVLNEMSDMMLIQDLEFNIIWANKTAYRIARLTNSVPQSEDIIGKKCFEVYYSSETPCFGCPILPTVKTKQSSMIKKHNEEKDKWYVYNVYPIFEGNQLTSIAYISREITMQKKLEDELQETYQLYESVVHNVDLSINTADKNGNLLTYNKGSEKIFGWTPDEIIGKSNNIFHRAEDHEALVPQILKDAREKGKYEGIVTLIRKNKEEFLASLTVTPIFDSQKEIKAYVGIAKELT